MAIVGAGSGEEALGYMSLLAAEWGVGQVLWSMLWFFLFVVWIWLVISIFTDIMRSGDLSGWGKAIWAIAIIVVPYLGIFAYLIARGGQMGERAMRDAQAQQDAFRSYVQDVSASTSPAEQLATLAQLHETGRLSDAEYTAAKAKVVGV
ncbi:MAG: SHOCT domain-containing protein [Acidimicrobiia bacterium]|nr:SHOCT domain-containing protein [Acidimicrobiia bacterium]